MDQQLEDIKKLFVTHKDRVTSSRFQEILKASGLFADLVQQPETQKGRSKGDAYFRMLDKDRDGVISFQDFLSPYLPVLNPNQISNLLKGTDHFQAEHFLALRQIYQEERASHKITDLHASVNKLGNQAVSKLFSQLAALYPQNLNLNEEEFSGGLARLEKSLLYSVLPPNSYIQGNRTLGEYVLSLKDQKSSATVQQEDYMEEQDLHLDSLQNLSHIQMMVNQAKEGSGKALQRKDIQALDMLLMEHSILQRDLQELKTQNLELATYKTKFEKLQSDVQNNIIAQTVSVDSKSILNEFKDQNDRQMSLIESLKEELNTLKLENDLFRKYNAGASGGQRDNQSMQVMKRLLERSNKQQIDFKNIQLKKFERQEQEVSKQPRAPPKSEFLVEQSAAVSHLKSIFESSSSARQKAFEKNLGRVEQEIQRRETQTKESLDQAQLQVEQMKLSDKAQVEEEKDIVERLETAQVEPTVEERLAALDKSGMSDIQKQFERNLIKPDYQVKNISSILGNNAQKEMSLEQIFGKDAVKNIKESFDAQSVEEDPSLQTIYGLKNKVFRITGVQKKKAASLLISSTTLYLLSHETMRLDDFYPLKSIDSIVLSTEDHQVLAIRSLDKPDLLLELSENRTEVIIQLIALFEQHEDWPRFNLYFSSTLFVKERFSLVNTKLPKSSSSVVVVKEITEESKAEAKVDSKVVEEQQPFSPAEDFTGFSGGDDSDNAVNFFEEVYKQNVGTWSVYQEKFEKIKGENDRLAAEITKYDKKFIPLVIDNIYLMCVRSGYIWKCTQRVLKSDEWSEKFCVLTNAGFVYFNTKKKGDYDPRKFYPLNDFQIKEMDEKTAKRKFAFKIIFEHQEVAKDLIMACNTQLQQEQWIIALREHQRQFLEARKTIYEQKLKEISFRNGSVKGTMKK